MEQSPSWEANSHLSRQESQENPRLLRNIEVLLTGSQEPDIGQVWGTVWQAVFFKARIC
jgi:hypothetical protein